MAGEVTVTYLTLGDTKLLFPIQSNYNNSDRNFKSLSEYNLISLAMGLSGGTDSYVISYDNLSKEIEFVLFGHYMRVNLSTLVGNTGKSIYAHTIMWGELPPTERSGGGTPSLDTEKDYFRYMLCGRIDDGDDEYDNGDKFTGVFYSVGEADDAYLEAALPSWISTCGDAELISEIIDNNIKSLKLVEIDNSGNVHIPCDSRNSFIIDGGEV